MRARCAWVPRRAAPLALVLLALAALPGPPHGLPPAYARIGGPGLDVGIHGPNRPWEAHDFALVAHGEFAAVKMMGSHPPEAYARLREQHPATRFLVRLETPWNELPAPARFVAANAPRLRELVAAGYEPWVELGNEPNLELHPEAEAAFAAWYEATLHGLRAAVPEAKYGFPGLARDLREGAWLEAAAAVIEKSDWLGAHAYWGNEREMRDPHRALRFTRLHARFPRLPLVVTEAGNHAPGLSKRDRAVQYAHFIRVLDRLPYVRGVYFFIVGGTPDWQQYFFDYTMATIVHQAAQEVRQTAPEATPRRAASARVWAPGPANAGDAGDTEAGDAAPRAARRAQATPTPSAFARRVLLAEPDPVPDGPDPLAPWTDTLPAAGLRSASAYTATDFSVRLSVAPPAPGMPFALQLAEADLFGPGAARAAGVALLWDGARWRLQYWRDGQLAAESELSGTPETAWEEGWEGEPDWLQLELALEARSAAAWVWRRGEPQPAAPNAVFAPPTAPTGGRPRALFLPAHPLRDVVLEGGTRFS